MKVTECENCGRKEFWTSYQCTHCGKFHFTDDDDWISVKVRLPEKPGNYIVAEYWDAYDNTDVRQRAYGGKDYGWVYSDNEKEEDLYYQGYKLIAWQPLPEPPKEDE